MAGWGTRLFDIHLWNKQQVLKSQRGGGCYEVSYKSKCHTVALNFVFFFFFAVQPCSGFCASIHPINPSWAPAIRGRTHESLRVWILGTSPVDQWLRICLPMQVTLVWSLVLEDPTCCRAMKPPHCNYWECMLQLLKPAGLEPGSTVWQKPQQASLRSLSITKRSSLHSPQLEEAHTQQWRPSTAKNN